MDEELFDSTGHSTAVSSTTGDAVPSQPTVVGAAAHGMPERIGRYRIRRLIGAGGMGAVYEAVQEQPRRTVALKVLGMRMASPAALRRFEYEAQVLARLRHPAIAQIFEAGTHTDPATGATVPYFAMEYVPGARPLTEYAAAKGLSVRSRLELFSKVCDAVQHGHHKGIIHRDLKPANVLVDSAGQPKVIDFGVARATDGDQALATFETQVGQLIGTIQYMSPEQCMADPHDLDVRSDVYSLGVVLYEMLSGRLPYDLSRTSIVEATRVVQHQAAARLSQLDAALRGDVETIVQRALEKDRDRRYQSVEALAADIGRFLRDEPIQARPVGPAGRLVRWVRRNKALATATGTGLGTLAVVSTVLVGQIIIERNRATESLRAAQASVQLVKGLFGSMRPDQLERGLVNVEELLDGAAEQLAKSPPDLKATEADFREILGQGYMGLGLYSQAITHHRRGLELRETLHPANDPTIAASLHQLAAALWWHGDYDEAEVLYRRSLEVRRELHGAEHAAVAASLTHLAACHLTQGRIDDAERLYTEALEMRRRLQGPRSEDVAASLNNLGKCLRERGEYVLAESHCRRALDMITALVGDTDLRTTHASHNLAQCLLEMGKPEEAAEHFERALTLRMEKHPPTHHMVATSQLGLARARFVLEPSEAALSDAQLARVAIETEMPGGHPDVAEAYMAVGEMLMVLGRAAEAEPLLRRSLEITQGPTKPVVADVAEAQARLGLCLAEQGRSAEAEGMLLGAFERLGATPEQRRLRAGAAGALAELYRSSGEAAKAARFSAAAAEGPG